MSALSLEECQPVLDRETEPLTPAARDPHPAAQSEPGRPVAHPATLSVLPILECQPVLDTKSTGQQRPAPLCSCPGCPARARKKRKRREMETAEYAGMLRRTIRVYGVRIADGDPEDLAAAVQLAADLDQVIDDAARAMRTNTGYSWAELGRALGTTRQAAQQRYGVPQRVEETVRQIGRGSAGPT